MCVRIRIGILNQLSPAQIGEIVSRFAGAMLAMGAEFDSQKAMSGLKSYYAKAACGVRSALAFRDASCSPLPPCGGAGSVEGRAEGVNGATTL